MISTIRSCLSLYDAEVRFLETHEKQGAKLIACAALNVLLRRTLASPKSSANPPSASSLRDLRSRSLLRVDLLPVLVEPYSWGRSPVFSTLSRTDTVKPTVSVYVVVSTFQLTYRTILPWIAQDTQY